jgi:chromosome segregation ATPase
MQTNQKPNAGQVRETLSDIPDMFLKNGPAAAPQGSPAASPAPARPLGRGAKHLADLADIPDLFFKAPSAPQPETAQVPMADPHIHENGLPALTLAQPEPPNQANPADAQPTLETRAAKSQTEFARRTAAEKARATALQQNYSSEMQLHRLEAVQEAETRKHLENNLEGLAAANALLERRLMELNRNQDEVVKYSAELQDKLQAAEQTSGRETVTRQRLEAELAEFRQERDTNRGQLLAQQQSVLESQRRLQELEQDLRARTAELERARTELDKATAERMRLDSERKELRTPGVEDTHLSGNTTLRKVELERQVREGVATLAHATAELENEKGERRRAEQRIAALSVQLQNLHDELSQHLEAQRGNQHKLDALEQQIEERDEALARARADLQKEAAERRLVEEELRTAADLGRQMQNNLALYEETRNVFKSSQDQLETRLQASLGALNESESKFQKESNERRRLMEALEESQRALKEHSQTTTLELSKLQSALQLANFERKCLETDLLRIRQGTVNSARTGRVLVQNLRGQLKQPVTNLYQFACQLLQNELPDGQKKLAELLLENALLLQTTLRENEAANGNAGPDADAPTNP